MKSTLLPQKLKQNILQAFQELPYKVLWKFEEESMPGKPDNVEIRKWLPQQDILGILKYQKHTKSFREYLISMRILF